MNTTQTVKVPAGTQAIPVPTLEHLFLDGYALGANVFHSLLNVTDGDRARMDALVRTYVGLVIKGATTDPQAMVWNHGRLCGLMTEM